MTQLHLKLRPGDRGLLLAIASATVARGLQRRLGLIVASARPAAEVQPVQVACHDAGSELPLPPAFAQVSGVAVPYTHELSADGCRAMSLHLRGGDFCLYRPADVQLIHAGGTSTLAIAERIWRPTVAPPANGSLKTARIKGRSAGRRAWPLDELAELVRFLYGLHHDMICLHAALLDSAAGSLLIAGPSGSGKSTTALALARAGARLHTDENTFLQVTAPNHFFGVPLTPKIAGAPLASLQQLDASLGGARETKSLVRRSTIRPQQPDDAGLSPGIMIFLGNRSGSAHSQASPLTPAAALPLLLEQVIEAAFPVRKIEVWDALVDLAVRVPAWRLHPGTDLDSLAGLILGLRRDG